MGTQKFFRNGYMKGGLQVAGNSTFQGNLDIEGAVTAKSITPSSGTSVVVETVSSTATTAKNYGLSVISTTKTGTRKFHIGNPAAGRVKYITLGSLPGSSSKVLIRCSSTKPYIVSTTGGAARRSMNFATSGMGVTLVGVSTGVWAVAAHFGGAYGSSFST